MTQNTKQNVRTRKQQIEDAYLDDGDFTFFQEIDRDDFEKQLEEARARGAEEQRRKDAEGQDPAGWVLRPEMRLRSAFTVWPSPMAKVNEWNIPLYTRPANVAALEARVKELEAENDHQRTQILEFRNADRRIRLAAERVCSVREGSEIFQARIALRAALTREGGE